MKLPPRSELVQFLTIHHLLNAVLSCSFYISKVVPFLCHALHKENECFIQGQEFEVYLFLVAVVMLKNRRATSWAHYVSTFFLFSKLANLVLFYRSEPKYAFVFALIWLVEAVFLPEPVSAGPDRIVYFRAEGLNDELNRDKRTAWIVAFYTNWSPACTHFKPVFAKLSVEYSLANLKFGKLDVGRYSKESERFGINSHPTSKQLPTIVLYRNGKEIVRRPTVDSRGRSFRYVFSEMAYSSYSSHDNPDSSDMEHFVTVDTKRHRFPYCVVWTPIPLLTWMFPFVGHMGIGTSSGVIRDFAGSYYVAEDDMGFGWPTKYWQLSPEKMPGGLSAFDKAVSEASEEYKMRPHNLICDNCHSHVALALNSLQYANSKSWNMVRLTWNILTKGHYVGISGFLKQWLPFLIIVTIILCIALIPSTAL